MGVIPSLQDHDKRTVLLLPEIRFLQRATYRIDLSKKKLAFAVLAFNTGTIVHLPESFYLRLCRHVLVAPGVLSVPSRRLKARYVSLTSVPSNTNTATHIYFIDLSFLAV